MDKTVLRLARSDLACGMTSGFDPLICTVLVAAPVPDVSNVVLLFSADVNGSNQNAVKPTAMMSVNNSVTFFMIIYKMC